MERTLSQSNGRAIQIVEQANRYASIIAEDKQNDGRKGCRICPFDKGRTLFKLASFNRGVMRKHENPISVTLGDDD